MQKFFPYKPDLRTILSGILIAALVAPFCVSFLVWFCLVPWFFALTDCKNKIQILAQSLWLSFIFGLLAFYWAAIGIHNNLQVTWFTAALLSLFLFLVHQPQFLIFPFIFSWWRRREANRETKIECLGLLGLAFLYVWVNSFFPKFFSDNLGDAFSADRVLRQVADLGGTHLLCFLAVFVNIAIWYVFSIVRKKGKAELLSKNTISVILTTFLLILAATAYGKFRLLLIDQLIAKSTTFVNAVGIQANIDHSSKANAKAGHFPTQNEIVNRYITLSSDALTKHPEADFVIWPETSYPSTYRRGKDASAAAIESKLENFVKGKSKPLVFGSFDFDFRDNKLFNALTILDVELRTQIYHKNHLLPLAEYWPGTETFPFLKSLFPKLRRMAFGEGPNLLHIQTTMGNTAVLPVICYEAIVEDYVSAAARLGSKLILNIADDSWFGKSNEPYLHLNLAIFASVETRLPQMRATNSGVSALILPNGDIINATDSMSTDLPFFHAPIINADPSLFLRWGDWFSKWSGVAGLALVLI